MRMLADESILRYRGMANAHCDTDGSCEDHDVATGIEYLVENTSEDLLAAFYYVWNHGNEGRVTTAQASPSRTEAA